ncbi:unnamed protein product [Moneuplotes crassus]|uniref:BZIP domain-containing protein n=2 Tax=Euplotes crassus TaxID=5936 RepID=A0AAD1UKW7_EUPCR|nr:unnamed protein product [Moneuplotes crassus]
MDKMKQSRAGGRLEGPSPILPSLNDLFKPETLESQSLYQPESSVSSSFSKVFKIKKVNREGFENLSDISESLSIEEKRRKGRIRAKNSRIRRKNYLVELQNKICALEKENFRLQNLLIAYRREKFENVSSVTQSFAKDMDRIRKKTIQKFIDPTKMQAKEGMQDAIATDFRKSGLKIMENHQNFLDRVFEMLINHPYPTPRFSYWKELGPVYNTDYSLIKKLQRISKFEEPGFIKEHGLTEMDQVIASMSPNKKQFEFLRDVRLKKEFKIKTIYKEGISYLCKAKSLFEKATVELCALTSFLSKCNIFSDSQIINARLKDGFFNKDDSFTGIWQIKVSQKPYHYDMAADEIYGHLAAKLIPREEQQIRFTYNEYSLPS